MSGQVCTSDNLALAVCDWQRNQVTLIGGNGAAPVKFALDPGAESAIKAARSAGMVTAPLPGPELTVRKPLWWKVTIVKHSDAKVIRNVTGRRPTVAEIRKHGWHEVHDDGDEHFVHPDAIAEIAIEGGFATAPADALAAHMINPKQRGAQ